MGRIAGSFASLRERGETALIPYLMAGYPSLEATKDLLHAVVHAGADLVELGVPFSDPLADGATLQRASHQALAAGTTLRHVLELVASVRSEVEVPLVLMTYVNPVLRMGLHRFAFMAGAAGVDGLIVPDLPVEEAADLRRCCARARVDLVGMVAPTTPAARVRKVTHGASGFVYCVSLRGVTGARSGLSAEARPLVDLVRAETDLPAVVGFGVSTPAHVSAVTSFADGAVVASALIDRIAGAPHRRVEAAASFVRELKTGCRRRLVG